MDILLYLTELLQTRKTVGIVGLGTLYKKKSPGKYDVEKHAFVPPIYTIAFTTEIKEQEELANFISSKRNITTDSSNYYIGEFAERIQNQLAENQEADLEPIGKLKLVNDEIIFVAEQESSFGFEFYGLPTLTEITPEEENTPSEIAIPETVETEYLEKIEEENKLEEENPGQETTEENVLLNDEQETFEEITEVENKLEEENTSQENTVEVEENVLLNDEQETFEEIAEVENKIAEENPGQETTDEVEENVLLNGEQETFEEIAEVENKIAEENTDEVEENVLLNDEQDTFEEITEVENRTTEKLENTFIQPQVSKTVEDEEKEEIELFFNPKAEVDIEEEEPKKGLPFLIKVLIILLIIIAAGAITYFINPPFFNKYLKNFEGKPEKNIPVAPVDSLKKKADSLLADSLARTNAMVNLATDTPAVDSSKVTVYEVLVSAVDKDKKANKIIANLAKNGVKAKKIKLSKTMINISAGSFLVESDAKLRRDSLIKLLKDKGIYIQPVLPKTHKN